MTQTILYRYTRARLILIWVTLTCAGMVCGFDFGPDQPYDKLSNALVTPHIPFAKPRYGGSLNVLVIAPTWTHRETVELAQRLEMNYTPLMTESFENFGFSARERYMEIEPEQFEQVAQARLGKDARYGVIIIGKMPWNVFPEWAQTAILAKVKEGTGLVYINPSGVNKDIEGAFTHDPHAVSVCTEGIPLTSIPGLSDAKLRAGTLGWGRCVLLNYAQREPKGMEKSSILECLTPSLQEDDPLWYDYCFALLAKCCLWAAKREPDVTFANVVVPDSPVARARLSETRIRVELQGAREGWQFSWNVRDRQGRVEAARAVTLDQGKASFLLPFLKNGMKVLDLWVKERDRTVNWYSVPFEVIAPVRIVRLELVSDILRKGEAVNGKFILSQPLATGASIYLTATDNFGREVARLSPPARGTEVPFTFLFRNPLTKAHTVKVILKDGNGTLDEAEIPFYINTREPVVNDFSFFAWGSAWGKSRSVTTYLQQFHHCGIDTLYNTTSLWDDYAKTREIALRITRANLCAAPYATRLFLVSNGYPHLKSVPGPDGPEVQNCPLALSAEEKAKHSGLAHVRDLARAFGPLGPAFYSLGDENALSWPGEDVCFCAKCQRSFRDYLKNIYGNLAAVNAEWGTEYTDWQQVKPITLLDAYKQQRYPQWIDHRLHMDKLFADLHGTYTQAILEVDPKAKVGMEGPVYPTHSYTGFDLYQMLQHFKYFNPYNAVPAVKTMDFMPKDSITGIWFGSYRGETREEIMRYTPWHCLFEGMTAVGWWTTGVGGNQGLGGAAAYSPDFSPLSFFQKACDEIAEIKGGIGKLLLTSQRVMHPIAVYYSNSCLHASTIRYKDTTWENSLNDFHFTLRDGGYEYRYLTPTEIQSGALARYRVLLLPYAQAMSAKDVTKIRQFVSGGGLLIADFSPAIMDEHGKTLDKSALLDVFGEFTRMHINTFGKGKAVYLADYLKGYRDRRKGGEGQGVCAGLARLLSEIADLKPLAEVTDASGQTRQDIEVSAFKNGKATHICLLRVPSAGAGAVVKGPGGSVAAGMGGTHTSPAHVKLPFVAHVYDVREKKYMGQLGEFEINLHPAQAKIFTLLPARIEKLNSRIKKTEYNRGEEVSFSATLSPPSLKGCGLAVRVEMFRPDGRPLLHYTQKLVSAAAAFNGIVPLSLNEQPGTHKLVMYDIISGSEAIGNFTVK